MRGSKHEYSFGMKIEYSLSLLNELSLVWDEASPEEHSKDRRHYTHEFDCKTCLLTRAPTCVFNKEIQKEKNREMVKKQRKKKKSNDIKERHQI